MRRALSNRLSQAFARLASWQIKAPWSVIAIGAVFGLVGLIFASRLELRTRFDQLLPDHQPSVVELRRLGERVGAQSKVFVVLEGSEREVLRSMGDDLVIAMRGIGPAWVTDAEDGVQAARSFLEPRAGLFANVGDLEKLRDDLEARWQWEVGEETGTNLDDAAPPAVTAADIRKRFGLDRPSPADRYPDGYYQSKDGHAVVVVAHCTAAPGDLGKARETLERVRLAVGRASQASPRYSAVRVGFAGDLVTGLAEYGAVRSDLLGVGALGVTLVLAVVLLFFMRLRALAAMGITMAAGLSATFGATQLVIGHLNVATGFLVSIVAGNGINFGIIYMARYFEERRAGQTAPQSLVIAHETTWPSTLTAAVAAAAAYGSLGITDFRAFKHFAFIGGFGMMACWVATYALLPAVLIAIDRIRPFEAATGRLFGFLRARGTLYASLFAAAVVRAPRAIASVGIALAVVGAALLVPYVRSDPMEYDMRRLQNDLGQSAEMYRISHLAAKILGADVDGAMVVALDSVSQVKEFVSVLDARRAAALPGEKPFEAVHSALDFVPPSQPEKVPVLLAIRDRLMRARERGSIDDADWQDIENNLPPTDLRPFDVDDLPADVARPFTEKNGIRGRLVLIEPTAGKSDSDLHYLLKWAESFRETRLPSGEVVYGSGRAVIFADMLQAVEKDIPHSIVLSLGLTILAVLITFRRGASAAAVLGSLGVGVGWVIFAMVATHTKIHFFNFVALPITFGIGVDYAVNVVQRYEIDEAEGRRGIVHVLRSTGGAVVLCSLTTILGYLALLTSINQAIRGLGMLAVLGEVGCLLAAVLVLPAALVWRERARLSPAAATMGSEIALPAPSQRHLGSH